MSDGDGNANGVRARAAYSEESVKIAMARAGTTTRRERQRAGKRAAWSLSETKQGHGKASENVGAVGCQGECERTTQSSSPPNATHATRHALHGHGTRLHLRPKASHIQNDKKNTVIAIRAYNCASASLTQDSTFSIAVFRLPHWQWNLQPSITR